MPAYRLAPDLLVRPSGGASLRGLLANDDTVLSLTPEVASTTLSLPETFSREEFISAFQRGQRISLAAIEALWDQCVISGLVIPCAGAPNDVSAAALPWDDYGWGLARIFHEALAAASFVQGDAEGWRVTAEISQHIAHDGAGPPIVKEYFAADTVALPAPSATPPTDFFASLLGRRTTRTFAARSLSVGLLSTLLHYSARSHGTLKNPYFGEHLLRTSPSGGARHPVELYVVPLAVDGLPRRVFYYDPKQHALREIGPAEPADIETIGQHQAGCYDAPLALIVSARFGRNMWKYRYSKSYVFTILDVGHFVQTLVLTATALDLGCFLTPALNVREAQRLLRLDNIYDECATYLVTVGYKPNAA